MSKSVDDAIRIRDNQRRSRARRKDLIKDLQARVQEYELNGVTATQEMQRAARRVAQENERLRILLARQGVLKDEVDAFLRTYETTESFSEPKVGLSSMTYTSAATPYLNTTGPRSLHTTSPSPAYQQEYGHGPPLAQGSRQPLKIQRQSSHQTDQRGNCGPKTTCGPTTRTPTTAQAEAAIMSRTVEACRQAESYYASPSETDSSPPRPQEDRPAFAYADTTPSMTQRQDCCPSSEPQPEVAMEDPDCPSTADCFCPPTAAIPPPKRGQRVGSDEISCETAASIIAQMRGDGDDAAARVSIGCGPGQSCTIKNSFLMQILDER
ncbi:hypothetical protein SVAN01_04553 [Stagonosporopsis vannaccii]|nr:hypothetical protein SVAN01_04553 [Stagonosporopsis vannaccii]